MRKPRIVSNTSKFIDDTFNKIKTVLQSFGLDLRRNEVMHEHGRNQWKIKVRLNARQWLHAGEVLREKIVEKGIELRAALENIGLEFHRDFFFVDYVPRPHERRQARRDWIYMIRIKSVSMLRLFQSVHQQNRLPQAV